MALRRDFISMFQAYKESVSQIELYSLLGSGLPGYEYRKTAHTLDSIYTSI